MKNIKWSKHGGFLIALLVFFLLQLLRKNNDIFHSFYYNYIYTIVRYTYSYLFSWLPFANIYIILPLAIFAMIRYWRFSLLVYSSKLKEFFRKLLNIVGIWYAFFYVLWGFNYTGIGVKDRMGFKAHKIDSIALFNEISEVVSELKSMRIHLSSEVNAIYPSINYRQIEKNINQIYNKELPKLGYKTFPNTRVRLLKPSGTLLCISTAGVYIPYTLEGHVDPGLHPIQFPFTIAHEMAHVFGVTDEGECNFLAYLVCRQSKDPLLIYSATLGYWRYLHAEVRFTNENKAKLYFESLDKPIQNDLIAIRQTLDNYPDLFPALRNAIYDYYLKTNGITSGLDSYNEMIELIIQYKSQPGLQAFK